MHPGRPRRGFTMMPNEVADDARLSPAARMLFCLLASHCNPLRDREWTAWAGNNILAARLGVSPRHVVRLLAELVDAGYATVEASPRHRIVTLHCDCYADMDYEGMEERGRQTNQRRRSG